jgi:hypothetical protein
MATYPTKSSGNHSLRNKFLKVAALSVMAFSTYQFCVPDTAKDFIGQKVEHVTGSHALGHAVSTLHPWEKPLVQVNLPKPGT